VTPSPLTADLRLTLGDTFLASAIAGVQDRLDRTIVVGLAGPQGSGKSTTAARLARRLSDEGRVVVVRSIDDFYLTHAERQRLAADIHPLLATRGVPGTHDVPLAMRTLMALRKAVPGQVFALPAFDKATDDRADPEGWPRHVGRPDVILFEGWCVGVQPQPDVALANPVNALEREEDEDERWRRFVNDRLRTDYAELFALLDLTILLRAPSFDQIYAWRAEQEAGLDRSMTDAHPPMTDDALRRFIAHYERLTRWMMAEAAADIVVDLDMERRPNRWQIGVAV
jgi:D-glycerate 3-kinase